MKELFFNVAMVMYMGRHQLLSRQVSNALNNYPGDYNNNELANLIELRNTLYSALLHLVPADFLLRPENEPSRSLFYTMLSQNGNHSQIAIGPRLNINSQTNEYK
ncbi:MAG: hypothetical protein V4538_01575 [Bacteroidota bacterium]